MELCRVGHPLTPDNVMIDRRQHRRCLTCMANAREKEKAQRIANRLPPRPRLTVEELEHFVDAAGPCWLWTRYVGPGGYGLGKRPGTKRTVLVHRFIYEMLVGPIPEGLVLDHLCQVRHCVNPDHLEPVTHRVNGMRSQNVSAVHARATACKHGHEYNDVNTFLNYKGVRTCRPCRRRREAERSARKAGGR